jgi:transposase
MIDTFRFATKRSVEWVGYMVHLTETCDAERPCVITHVETTLSTVPDDQVVGRIHRALADKHVLPADHLLDAGHTTTRNLLESITVHQINLLGPMADDASWQGRSGKGFAKQDFRIDWENRRAICPAGVVSRSWTVSTRASQDYAFVVHWAKRACRDCAYRSHCTKRTNEQPRELFLKTQAEEAAMQAARARQATPTFQAQYQQRAGVESTHAQALRRCDLRHARYRGLAKTRLQHVLTAAALNLVRVSAWLAETPRAPTRRSPFARLQISTP